MTERPTIEEIEAILRNPDTAGDIEVKPDGSIHVVAKGTAKNANVKPITFKYAVAEFY